VQEAKLKDEYVLKQQQAINLDLYRQQLREIDSSFGALLRQLPKSIANGTRCLGGHQPGGARSRSAI